MSLSTIGSIATHIVELFNNIPLGVSGNMVEIVDVARQNVANYTGANIGSNSILDVYQPAIVNYSKADVIDLVNAQTGGGANLALAELSISDSGEQMSATQFRLLADSQLNNIGRKIRFARSIS